MIIDKLLRLMEAVAYTVWGNAGTYYSTPANIIDLGVAGGAQIDDPPELVVRMGIAAATGTSLAFYLVCSDAAWTDTAGTGVSNEVVLASSGAIATASLLANTEVWKVRLPRDIPKRYVGIKYVSVESSDFTTGTIDAFIPVQPTALGAF
jgi:hypothetical protein